MSASTGDEAKTSTPEKHTTTISDVLNSDHQIDNAALVLLNVPLHKTAVKQLWKACSSRLCADGAASRLCELNTGSDGPDLVPDVITGDMDSANPTALRGFVEAGAVVVKDPDQDRHDLDKCLTLLRQQQEDTHAELRVIVYGGFGGRADHVLSNLAVLYRWAGVFGQLVVMSEDSACMLLQAGATAVAVSSCFEGPHCGLIPLGYAVEKVTTTGLEWDLHGQSLEMHGLVSSSNKLKGTADSKGGSTVTVETTSPLLWCLELRFN